LVINRPENRNTFSQFINVQIDKGYCKAQTKTFFKLLQFNSTEVHLEVNLVCQVPFCIRLNMLFGLAKSNPKAEVLIHKICPIFTFGIHNN